MITLPLNETLLKIQLLLDERNWSIYKLAKESGIPYSSLNSLFQKNNQPTISTLEKICHGFHISMAEFFSETTPYREIKSTCPYTPEEHKILEDLRTLDDHDKMLLLSIIKVFLRNAKKK